MKKCLPDPIWLQPSHTRASGRVQQAFRPATVASYRRKVRIFLAYCCFIQIQLCQLTPVVLLSFLEFLTENGISHSAIANYISAVKASLSMYGISTLPFYDERIKYFQKSLALHKPFTATIKKIIDILLLKDIVAVCDTMWMGQVFKSLYLTVFFSFLRISNLVPHTVATFSPPPPPPRTAHKRRHIFCSTRGPSPHQMEQDHANKGCGQTSKASSIACFTLVSSPSSQKSVVVIPR